jgi:cell division septal protein FtsQ
MATKKRTTKRTTTLRSNSKPTRRRRTSINSRRTQKPSKIFNYLVPLVFIIGILFALGFLLFKGYQTVTASSFFDMKKVEIRGISRVTKEDIERIVRLQTEQNGVWNVELEQIKADVEKLNFVKTAVVSRILPDGILVKVDERVPRAIVRLTSGDFWVDDDAILIGGIGKNENRPPFVLRGWDEAKTEKAQKDNQERVKVFTKTLDEWKTLGLEKNVTALNLSDLQDATAIIEDSGNLVLISLGKEDYGKRMQRALSVVQGKGQTIESLISHGGNVVAKYRNS